MIDLNKIIFIGRILKPFSVNGKLKIFPLTDFPERFSDLKKVYLFNEIDNQFVLNKKTNDFDFYLESADIKSIEDIKLKFKDYDSINDVEMLSKLYICIDENLRVKLKKGVYYFYEMIGCDVYDGKTKIGTLQSVNNLGSSDILNVKARSGEILIPLVKEFVKKIDIKNKIILTELIDGFYEKDQI